MPVNSFEHYPLTWKPDRNKLQKPYYLHLAADLESKIRTGQILAGTKLPPQREIADYLDLNLSTITKAYDLCREKGLLVGITGRGTFVTRHFPGDSTLAISSAESEIIDLSALSNFSERCTPASDALKQLAEDLPFPGIFDYSYPMGMPHQLSAGIQWLEQIGVHTDAGHTSIVTGGQNGLMVALLTLFAPGDCIAVDRFTYASFIEMAKMMHIHLIAVETDEEGMCPDILQRKCAERTIKGIYLMPSCTNPTTVAVTEKRRDQLAEVIQKEKLILIEDDIASWLGIAAGLRPRSLFDRLSKRCVYICGMSKSICPGVRVAYMAYSDDLKLTVQNGIFNLNVKTSSLDAEIITRILNSKDAIQLIKGKYVSCQKANKLYEQYFPEEQRKDVCFFRWLPIPSHKPGSQVEAELLQRGVRVFHSDRFMPEEGIQEAFLRISLGSAGNFRRLEHAFQILKEYCESEKDT